MQIVLDFETRSAVTELKKTGPWPYAEHPSTDVWCLAVKVDGQPARWIWSPKEAVGLANLSSEHLLQLIEQADEIHAHNVQFEQAIWHNIMHKRYGFPDLPIHKLRDTAAVAAMHALPRKLEQACLVMGLAQQKDMEGSKLMLKMCKPRAPRKAEWAELDKRFGSHPAYQGLKAAYHSASDEKLAAMCLYATRNWVPEMADMLLWHEDPADIERLCQYCIQDVEAEYALSQALGKLPALEMPVFQHDLVVQRRGIRVDVDMVGAALGMIAEHKRRLLAELDTLTSGVVRTPRQTDASRKWLASRGLNLHNMQADTVAEALKGNLDPDVMRFLKIRESLGGSATDKYEAALHQTCADGRLRGFAMYHGAGPGRWAGKGMQLHNLFRGVFDLGQKPDKNGRKPSEEAFWRAVELVRRGALDALILEFGDPIPILASTIRPLLMADHGHELMAADFSAIEGRGLAWLAEEEWVLDAYRAYDRGEGPDMYMVTAGKILDKPADQVTKKERKNPGKPADLGCGYRGGPNALTKFNATVPEEVVPYWTLRAMRDLAPKETQGLLDPYIEALGPAATTEHVQALLDQGWPWAPLGNVFEAWAQDVVNRWRANRPKTVALWKGLERASIECVESGEPRTYGPVTYRIEGAFLTCELPVGRKLYYPFPKLANREISYGERTYTKLQLSHMTVDAKTKQWVRRFVHGGLLTENITQAVCRDILAAGLLRLEANGFPVVLHVHDEAVGEVLKNTRTLEEFIQILTVAPPWAGGFPISAAGWVGERYRKD